MYQSKDNSCVQDIVWRGVKGRGSESVCVANVILIRKVSEHNVATKYLDNV